MNRPLRMLRLSALAVDGLAAAAVAPNIQAQSATATISGVLSGSVYDYTIVLHNTGSDNLNSFWYGWTRSGNNLPSNHSAPNNTSGWGNSLSGNSIEWVNSTGTALTPGNAATFTFTSTPVEITTAPAGESVAYVGGITFSENNPGDSTAIFLPLSASGAAPGSDPCRGMGTARRATHPANLDGRISRVGLA